MDDSRAQEDYVAGLMNVLMPAVEETDTRYTRYVMRNLQLR